MGFRAASGTYSPTTLESLMGVSLYVYIHILYSYLTIVLLCKHPILCI